VPFLIAAVIGIAMLGTGILLAGFAVYSDPYGVISVVGPIVGFILACWFGGFVMHIARTHQAALRPRTLADIRKAVSKSRRAA